MRSAVLCGCDQVRVLISAGLFPQVEQRLHFLHGLSEALLVLQAQSLEQPMVQHTIFRSHSQRQIRLSFMRLEAAHKYLI
jgi:hypothetical protein